MRGVWQQCGPEFDGSAAAISWCLSFPDAAIPHGGTMAKNSLRDKLEGDELDLSMMSLTEVPVKEIVSETKPVQDFLSYLVKRFLFGFLSRLSVVNLPGTCCLISTHDAFVLRRRLQHKFDLVPIELNKLVVTKCVLEKASENINRSVSA